MRNPFLLGEPWCVQFARLTINEVSAISCFVMSFIQPQPYLDSMSMQCSQINSGVFDVSPNYPTVSSLLSPCSRPDLGQPYTASRSTQFGVKNQNNQNVLCGYRGTRGGRRKQRRIQVVTTNGDKTTHVQRTLCQTKSNPKNLIPINVQKTRKVDSTSKHLNILYMNARSCRNKSNEINDLILDTKSDIVFITETWFKSSGDEVKISETVPPGYKYILDCREDRSGGGTAIIYREHFKVLPTEIDKLCFKSFQQCSLKFQMGNHNFLTSCLYRPTRSKKNTESLTTFLEEFSEFVDSMNNEPNIYLLGDFNLHYDKSEDQCVIKLKNLLDEHGLKQLVTAPTQEHNHILDLVIVRSAIDILSGPDVQDLCISDHKVISLVVDITKTCARKQLVKTRCVKKINMETFKQDVSSSISSLPPESASDIDAFNSFLRNTLDAHAPIRELLIPSRPAAPWITPRVELAKQERRQAERRWRRTGLTVHREIYKKQKTMCVNLIREEKIQYFNNRIEGSGSSKDLFRVCNQLLEKTNIPVLPNNILPSEMRNAFNSFFLEKIDKIRDTLDNEDVAPDFAGYSGTVLHQFKPVTESFVRKIILDSPKKFCELDPLPSTLFIECIDLLLPSITDFVNASLRHGVVSESMKKAIVRPLLKKSSLDQNILKNYRPVSNLPFLSKILEKVVLHQLKAHLVSNSLQEKFQSAYKCKHSTETALLKVTSDCLIAADRGKVSVLALLDLSAAFDTLDHDILIKRLSVTYGIRGTALRWFESYISDRYQKVATTSEYSLLKFGVPQGSVLGPILFTLYSQPLRDVLVKHGFSFHCYADDTQLYKHVDVTEVESAVVSLHECLDDVSAFMSANKLKLNQDKTEVIILGTPARVQNASMPSIQISDQSFSTVTPVKNLGVFLDPSLTMEKHISQIRKTAYCELRKISHLRPYLSVNSANKLVCSLVTSRIDYCNSLYAGITETQAGRLQQIQNNAARLVVKSSKREHVTPVLRQLHWLPVKCRTDFKIATIAHQCQFEDTYPSYLKDLVQQHTPCRSLRSANRQLLVTPRAKLKNYGQRALPSQAARVWNELPEDIQSIQSLKMFKKQLKTYLFKKYFG